MPIKGGYLLAAGAGGILLWSGINGHMWSATLRDLLSGKPVSQTKELAIQSSPSAFTSGQQSAAQSQLLPSGGGTAVKNKAIARLLAAPYGWSTGAEWDALDWIWTEESGWDNHAENPSGAYGIPQALPGSKMGVLANKPTSMASAQIAWGLRYIKTTYGDPVRAKAFHLAHGWY